MPLNHLQFKQGFEQGRVFAYPTEAVYGLGCDPLNEVAMNRVLKLKQRPVEKGVILIAGKIEELTGFVDFSKLKGEVIQRIQETWPGPFTWLVPKGPKTKDWISGGSALVAVRVTTHKLVQEMCSIIDRPMVSTSANIGGMPPATSASEVIDYFGSQVELIDGDLGTQTRPSTIINALTMEQIR